jgi:plastocyanin
MITKLAVLFSALTLAAVGFAACGSDDETTSTPTTAATTTETTDTGGGGGGGTIAISADPDGALAFTETEVSAPAGDDTLEFDNSSSTPHDVVIEDGDGNEIAHTDVISGETTTADAELEAGTYTFYCSVPGHREAGMEGTITAE